jgi:hypothetical protein
MKSYTTQTAIDARNDVNALWNEYAPKVAKLLREFKGQQFKADGTMSKRLRAVFDDIRPGCHSFSLRMSCGRPELHITSVVSDGRDCSYQDQCGYVDYEEFATERTDYSVKEYEEAYAKHYELRQAMYAIESKYCQL